MVPLDCDLVITTNFPSYYAKHPRKVSWLTHQHRGAYDAADAAWSDFGLDDISLETQRLLTEWDNRALEEHSHIYTISQVVTDRLARFNGLRQHPALPPGARCTTTLHEGPFGDYVFSPTRLENNKRPQLTVEALAHCSSSVRGVVAGRGSMQDELRAIVDRAGMADRVDLAGFVSDERLVELYAGCLAVVYPPADEDYGYVTLQAFKAGKPVITAKDSGGVLEWVEDGVNGFVTDGSPEAIGDAIDKLAADPELAARMGAAGHERVAVAVLATGGRQAARRMTAGTPDRVEPVLPLLGLALTRRPPAAALPLLVGLHEWCLPATLDPAAGTPRAVLATAEGLHLAPPGVAVAFWAEPEDVGSEAFRAATVVVSDNPAVVEAAGARGLTAPTGRYVGNRRPVPPFVRERLRRERGVPSDALLERHEGDGWSYGRPGAMKPLPNDLVETAMGVVAAVIVTEPGWLLRSMAWGAPTVTNAAAAAAVGAVAGARGPGRRDHPGPHGRRHDARRRPAGGRAAVLGGLPPGGAHGRRTGGHAAHRPARPAARSNRPGRRRRCRRSSSS